jgi:hypothetical protein
MAYWWCLDHNRVEPADGCAHQVRLGPYPTEQEASQALSKAHQRTQEWDRQDAEDDAWPRR